MPQLQANVRFVFRVQAQSHKAAFFPTSGQRTMLVCSSPHVGEGIEKKEKLRQPSLSLAVSGRLLFIACLEKLARCVSIRAATLFYPPSMFRLATNHSLPLASSSPSKTYVLPTRIHAPRCCTCLKLSSSPEANVPCPGSQSDSKTDSSSILALDGSGTRRTAKRLR